MTAEFLDDLGPFFAVHTDRFEGRLGAPWRPLRDLVDHQARLAERVAAVRVALAPGGQVHLVEERVAVSITHLGLVARVVAPQVAAALTGHHELRFDLDALSWQDRLGGPFPLSVGRGSDSATAAPPDLVTVETLTNAFLDRYAIGRQVLWGNVGSAINGAARQIGVRRPDLADAARLLADHLLADPRIDRGRTRSGPRYRRRSCCLIYRIARSRDACCGDCVLARIP